MQKRKRAARTRRKRTPAQHPPLILCRPPELRALIDTLREGFKKRRDSEGLQLTEKLLHQINAVGLESELASKWYERLAHERRAEQKRNQEKIERERLLMLEGVTDSNRLAEKTIQAMIWTDICRGAPEKAGAPGWERFEVRDQQGKPVRLLPRGSDEFRRFAGKAYLIKERLGAHFESLSPVDRMSFAFQLFQTPFPMSMTLNLRGKLKQQRLPSLPKRKAQYEEVRKQARDLWIALGKPDHDDHQHDEVIRQEIRQHFPEVSSANQLPVLKSAAFAHLVLGNRWGVTPSTVQTRLKR